MEKVVEDLRKIIKFKDTTQEGDIVLIIANDPQTIFYALVTDIRRDTSKQDEWWHLRMHALAIPPQKFVWTLRTAQFTGREIFTMGGEKRFIQSVDFENQESVTAQEEIQTDQNEKGKFPTLRVVK